MFKTVGREVKDSECGNTMCTALGILRIVVVSVTYDSMVSHCSVGCDRSLLMEIYFTRRRKFMMLGVIDVRGFDPGARAGAVILQSLVMYLD